jgi:proton glutamate symport protein
MKIKLPKLHNQILIALILGAIFGALFNVNKTKLLINTEQESIAIEAWEVIELIVEGEETKVFKETGQLEVINSINRAKSRGKEINLIIKNARLSESDVPRQEVVISGVRSISRETTIATDIKWIGDIFIRLLTMIAVPLVLGSLVVGAASLGDIRKFARIGGKTISLYIFSTAIAITIGLTLANIVEPGERMDQESKDRLLSVYSEDASARLERATELSFSQEIVNLVPKNPISALANAEMVQIVFFSVLFGLVLSLIAKEKATPVINFFDGLAEAMIYLVNLIMIIAPLGVFALIAATISEFGFGIMQTLFWYAGVVLLGLFLQVAGVYSLMIKIFTKINVFTFFKGIRRVQTIAFSTSSSAATLPVTIECCQDNLKISKSISGFVLPLGATINMDGTALYQGVAAVFIAQVFGMDLTLGQQLTIVFTATLASIGTAPVPGVGIIMLVVILKSAGIPEEGIALILGVDRILDMCRTVTNVTGDAAVASVVASTEKEIDYMALAASNPK